MTHRIVLCSVLLAVSLSLPAWASEQTLEGAYVEAYQKNPQLLSARGQLKILDERVSSAKSGWRPQIDAIGAAGYAKLDVPAYAGRDRALRPRSGGLQVVQSVFKGFRTLAEVQAAEAQVLAGRAQLEGAEQALFLSVASAYLAQLHAQTVVDLRVSNEEVLRQQKRATEQRLAVGEVTKTDLAQATARLDGAVAARVRAEGNLAAAKAGLSRLLGDEAAAALSLVKPTIEDAYSEQALDRLLETALVGNPSVQAAIHEEKAAKFGVDLAKGRILPELNLVGSVTRAWEQSPLQMARQDTSQIMAQVTIPLSHGGIEFSKARSAMQEATVKGLQAHDARLKVRESVIASRSQVAATKAAILSQTSRVEAALQALKGVREEYKVGTRTTLDVLDAEQELLDAKVSLAEAERDSMLAVLALRAALGQLTAEKMHLPVEKYDPTSHYDSVKSRWVGFDE